MANDKLVWQEYDLSKVQGAEAQKIIADYQAAKANWAKARESVDKLITVRAEKAKVVPDGHAIQVSHKYGKISFAFAPAKNGATKASKNAVAF